MALLEIGNIPDILDRLFYISLLGLGIFFIYKGDVIQRFQAQRTTFAVYRESMIELPTISTYIYPIPSNFSMGVDFNLTLEGKILRPGINFLNGSGLKVDFEHMIPELLVDEHGKKAFKFRITIRPFNFSLRMPTYFRLNYTFASPLPESQIGIYATSENNSKGCLQNYYDGEKTTVIAKGGDWFGLNLQPMKFLYLQKKGGCRKKPYMEELVANVKAVISERSGSICRPKNIFWKCLALTQSDEVQQLPVCHSDSDGQQFMDILLKAQKLIKENPCAKLSYDLKLQGPWSTNPSHTVFGVALAIPYDTIVNEEYVIYDMVAMISAIGGTMGLCIGFSFKDCSRHVIRISLKVLAKIAKSKNKTSIDNWEFQKSGIFGLKAHSKDEEEDIGKSLAGFRVQVTEQFKENVELRYQLARHEERLEQLEKRQNNPLAT